MADETGQAVAALGMEMLGLYGPLRRARAGPSWRGSIQHLYQTSLGHTIAGGTSEILRSTVATAASACPPSRGPADSPMRDRLALPPNRWGGPGEERRSLPPDRNGPLLLPGPAAPPAVGAHVPAAALPARAGAGAGPRPARLRGRPLEGDRDAGLAGAPDLARPGRQRRLGRRGARAGRGAGPRLLPEPVHRERRRRDHRARPGRGPARPRSARRPGHGGAHLHARGPRGVGTARPGRPDPARSRRPAGSPAASSSSRTPTWRPT